MKNGISMMMLVVSVSVMMILVTSASIIGINSVKTANFEEFKSVLSRVSDDVNYYYIKNGKLPVKSSLEGVEVIDSMSINSEFYNQVVANGDNNELLYIIDLEKLEDNTINFNIDDVFVVSEYSHNIYTLNGFRYKSKIYYKI